VQKVLPYDLKLSHNTSMIRYRRQTDRRTTTVPIAGPLLKYGRLKCIQLNLVG